MNAHYNTYSYMYVDIDCGVEMEIQCRSIAWKTYVHCVFASADTDELNLTYNF